MAEIFFTLFLFLAITCVTAVLFGGWVIISIIRFAIRGLNFVFGASTRSRPIAMKTAFTRTCVNPRCKSPNPSDAQFCRRCGQYLPQAQRVAARRAAMW